jgi:hypothetical protein
MLNCEAGYAQTVSILNNGSDRDAVLVEAALKRSLRAEGYTVKSDTNEGIVLILSVISVENRTGTFGYVGHIDVVSVNWQNFADLAVSAPCKEDHATAQQIKDYLGTRVIYHTSNMAIAADADRLADLLITGRVNATIRDTARKVILLLDEIKRQRLEPSQDIINPIR